MIIKRSGLSFLLLARIAIRASRRFILLLCVFVPLCLASKPVQPLTIVIIMQICFITIKETCVGF